ncbi:MAG: TPM domain-containing protein [Cyanobacteria bacterium]|nr:TPM domain-containing protein [Cyanobacteriota bacterium]
MNSPKLSARNLCLLLISLLLTVFCAFTPSPSLADNDFQPINKVPPQPTGLNIYINDWGGLINESDRQVLQSRLMDLDRRGKAQIAIVTLPDTDRELSEFAPEIIHAWGIGHKDKDNGILILCNAQRIRAHQRHRIFFATGSGVESLLPDGKLGRIRDDITSPAFDSGNYSQGIRDAALSIAGVLENADVSAMAKKRAHKPKGNGVFDYLVIGTFLGFIYGILRRPWNPLEVIPDLIVMAIVFFVLTWMALIPFTVMMIFGRVLKALGLVRVSPAGPGFYSGYGVDSGWSSGGGGDDFGGGFGGGDSSGGGAGD